MKVGDAVEVWETYPVRVLCYRGRVTRVTRTQVVVDGSRRFRRVDGSALVSVRSPYRFRRVEPAR